MIPVETCIAEDRLYGHPAANVGDVIVDGHGVASTADSELLVAMLRTVLDDERQP